MLYLLLLSFLPLSNVGQYDLVSSDGWDQLSLEALHGSGAIYM